ncbi:MAG: chromosomal replication initiator protein DnaA [Clostridia bacterium]|nr:MAG: chromosomal replication initiator protein DnaA [Clostridia bacterium]
MPSIDLNAIWQETLSILERELSRTSFETWLTSVQPIFYDHDRHILFMSAPDAFALQWLEDRYYGLVKSTLQFLTKTNLDVKFFLEGTPLPVPHGPSMEKNAQTSLNAALNPRYTFSNFVVGSSNRLAHAACLAVADSPGRSYNPLFIYGGVGLGKTHLMQAIGHRVSSNGEHYQVTYISSENFTNKLINAIRDDSTERFRNTFRNVDILLIDDIQFLAGKERTQEEFFHTFNTLHEAQKQIVISSDRPPREIPTLENRLRSRFEWGLITDIQPPDLETRIAILEKKASVEGVKLADEILVYIAERIESNIRELEGALLRLEAFARTTGKEINMDLVNEALQAILPPAQPRAVTVQEIQQLVARYFNLKIEDLSSKRRTQMVAFPRQIAMYLCRRLTDASLPQIGTQFGGRDHSTVIHACEKIATELETDPVLQQTVSALIDSIQEKKR